MRVSLGFVAAAAVVAAPAVAEDMDLAPVRYSPTSEWRLNSGGNGCTVIRDFTAGGQQLKFTMQQVHPGAVMQFGVFGEAIERPVKAFSAGFQPADEVGQFDVWADASVGDLDGFVFTGLPFPTLNVKASDEDERNAARAQFLDRVTNSETFAIEEPSTAPLELETGSILEPMSALEECLEKKLADLGITQALIERTASAPKPRDIAKWARELQSGYPAQALRSWFDGKVNVRLVVDEKGRVEHCDVITQMTAKILREAACEGYTEHGRYTPAQDVEGNAVKGVVLTAIHYVLSRGPGFATDAHGFKIKD